MTRQDNTDLRTSILQINFKSNKPKNTEISSSKPQLINCNYGTRDMTQFTRQLSNNV